MKLLKFTISVECGGKSTQIFNRFVDAAEPVDGALVTIFGRGGDLAVKIAGAELRPMMRVSEFITFKLEELK